MREPISKKQGCKLYPEQNVNGRWHKNRYKIIRELGWGATGTVYLTETKEGPAALKVGRDAMSITSEVNVLKHFSKVQGDHLGPSLIDVDDVVTPSGTYPFYVMEYLKGEEVLPFLRNRGGEWTGIIGVQLLGDLDRLHRAGWTFGDLKPENLLVTGPPLRVRWFDVGGTTKMGRSVKEYTEFFDRGYWGLGSRKAEPSYDLFSVGMIMINSGYPSRFERSDKDNLKLLVSRAEQKPGLKPYVPIITKALGGHYRDALHMRRELAEVIGRTHFSTRQEVHPGSGKVIAPSVRKPLVNRKSYKQQVQKEKKRSSGVLETVLVASFLLLAYVLYLFGQMM
ncbi:protein kinase family protein [Bacillus sp. H-16]|uniref:protein kinase domain-containing protein n=1 Tax=Alteribacter salitolerans TaxID=2912333 RepID=UPI001963BCC0|nr:phosphotransferase [Alteribacter salitolerans]MBM7097953.1 protein kinase family protein [Alteribacter salitolerans]